MAKYRVFEELEDETEKYIAYQFDQLRSGLLYTYILKKIFDKLHTEKRARITMSVDENIAKAFLVWAISEHISKDAEILFASFGLLHRFQDEKDLKARREAYLLRTGRARIEPLKNGRQGVAKQKIDYLVKQENRQIIILAKALCSIRNFDVIIMNNLDGYVMRDKNQNIWGSKLPKASFDRNETTLFSELDSPSEGGDAFPIVEFPKDYLLVDRYLIKEQIGSGGTSKVYLAEDIRMHMAVAVKCMFRNSYLNFEKCKRIWENEVNLQKRCAYPGLSLIRDYMNRNDYFFVVSDYIEGESLHDLIAKTGHIEERELVRWALQLCDILNYLHSLRPPIIFRDVKPSNVIIDVDGKVFLIDFDSATEEKEIHTGETVLLGTNGYAAPEQYNSTKYISTRTDIFGFGATLYHAATGHHPADPPFLSKNLRKYVPEISERFDEIVKKCVEQDPDERFQNMAELKAALEQIR